MKKLERLKFLPDYRGLSCHGNAEDILIEIIDTKDKWAPFLSNPKTKKWVLLAFLKNSPDEETKREALALYLHLYEPKAFLGE